MKQKKDYTLIAILIPFLFAVMASYPGCYSNVNKQAANVPYSTESDPNAFHVGDTLYPDMTHNDTLIVINADTLNSLFDGVDLPVPATDGEAILHWRLHLTEDMATNF